MAEYIEREALLEKQYNANEIANLLFENMVVDVRDIKEAPAADVLAVKHGNFVNGRGNPIVSFNHLSRASDAWGNSSG